MKEIFVEICFMREIKYSNNLPIRSLKTFNDAGLIHLKFIFTRLAFPKFYPNQNNFDHELNYKRFCFEFKFINFAKMRTVSGGQFLCTHKNTQKDKHINTQQTQKHVKNYCKLLPETEYK